MAAMQVEIILALATSHRSCRLRNESQLQFRPNNLFRYGWTEPVRTSQKKTTRKLLSYGNSPEEDINLKEN
jgi:hypothetical protein